MFYMSFELQFEVEMLHKSPATKVASKGFFCHGLGKVFYNKCFLWFCLGSLFGRDIFDECQLKLCISYWALTGFRVLFTTQKQYYIM